MVLEAHRGVIPALVTFIGILVGLVLTRVFYVPLSEHMRPSGAYMLLLGSTIVLILVLSMVIARRLRVHVTEVEAAIAAALGLGTAMLISYGFFEWLSIRYGGGSMLVTNSLLYWAMSEAAGVREVANFFHKLTGR